MIEDKRDMNQNMDKKQNINQEGVVYQEQEKDQED